jgi:CubicO group peptidase (beta-lactamase class C family)
MKHSLSFLILVPVVLTVAWLSPLQSQTRRGESWIGALNDAIVRESADKGFPSFAVIVVDREGIIAEVTHGHRALDGDDPVSPQTLYRTGSVGKTVTDLALMAAVEKGKVDLDIDVRSYLPDFRPTNPFESSITLRLLMTHQAGLVREPPVGHYFDDTSPSLAETVASLNTTTLLWQPGTRTKYSNAGLAVAGRVLEVVYGVPYREVIEALVFNPARMTTARVGFSEEMDDITAQGVMWQPEGAQWKAPVFDFGMVPAGDLYTSLGDMAALMISLLGQDGRVVQPETADQMWSPQFVPPRKTWHMEVGLGFSLNGKFADKHKMARNGGAVYGFATELALLPEEGLGVYAVAARDMSNNTVAAVAHWALRAALAERMGEHPPGYELTDKPFTNLPKRLSECSLESSDKNLVRYLGRYGWEHNPLVVYEKDNKLHVLVEWFFLYPLSETQDGTFAFPSWALYSNEQLRFVSDGGSATEAILGDGSSGIRMPRLVEAKAR